jgi:hypothetical protein
MPSSSLFANRPCKLVAVRLGRSAPTTRFFRGASWPPQVIFPASFASMPRTPPDKGIDNRAR